MVNDILQESRADGLLASVAGIAVNSALAAVKILVGIAGNSYALVADGIESATDVANSLIVWGGLRISLRPPDRTHPFGHGKAESLAAIVVSLTLVGAALLIATQSIREIHAPGHAPAWYTLAVLVGVIVIKESMYRYVSRIGSRLESRVLVTDAWHHRSDAITSLAAFVGISVALAGGEGYEAADDWAALVACAIILVNGIRLLRPAVDDVMDAAVPDEVMTRVRAIAGAVEGVKNVEKCRVRKSGLGRLVDIHITVDGDLTVRHGHDIGHHVKDALTASELLVEDVTVHIEPHDLNAA